MIAAIGGKAGIAPASVFGSVCPPGDIERSPRGDPWCYSALMARHLNLHQAQAEHYDFALRLYLMTMRFYMQELGVWDEQQQRASFAAQWKREEVRIISVDGKDVGWLQFAELPTEIRLQKFFVSPQYQRSGIGSEVLSNLLATWRSTGKKIVLKVLKNNPARRLYERLGFSVVAEAGVVFRMRG
jgi:ribosomal protein S18 acetylase RimI-like enzyme